MVYVFKIRTFSLPLYTNYSIFIFCWFFPIQPTLKRAVRQKQLIMILAFQSLNFYLHIPWPLIYYEQITRVLLFLVLLTHFSLICWKKHFLYPDSDEEDLGRQKTEGQLLGGRTKWQQYCFFTRDHHYKLKKRIISGILWFDFWTKVY